MTDLIPAPRPVPTTEDRMRDARTNHTFATYLDRTERDQLDARAACAEAERDEALDARNVLRQQLDAARAELGAAQELLAVVDDLAEQLDRARARYATQPGESPAGVTITLDNSSGKFTPRADHRHPCCGDIEGERDRLVETIGRLVSLPPQQIAKMHKVGYSGLGSAPPRAQEDEKPRIAPFGCDDCNVGHGQPHRYADCPTNLRQIERDAAREARR